MMFLVIDNNNALIHLNQGKNTLFWRNYIIISVIIVIVLLAATKAIWVNRPPEYSPPYYLPTGRPPDSWLTYTSRAFPYTFKYPPTWKFYNNSQSGGYDALYLSSPDLTDTNDPYYKVINGAVVTIDVTVSGSKDLDLKEEYDAVTFHFSDSLKSGKTYKSYDVYDQQYINLDGVKALRLDISRGDMVFGRGILVATVRNGKEYIIKMSQKDVNHLSEFDQILSSFRFTD